MPDLPDDGVRVFIGMPSYGGVQPAALQSADLFASKTPGRCLLPKVMPLSHHCGAMNALIATAWNSRRETGANRFAMIHQDVAPALWWIDKAEEELTRTGADCLAMVVPIKDEKGMTSVGILNRRTLCTRRLSMEEICQLPRTFSADDLAAIGYKEHILMPIAGLFYAKLDDRWRNPSGGSRFWFESPSRIIEDQAGNWVSAVWDEGWNLSIQMLQAGFKVLASRAVLLNHLGGGVWGNEEPWGEWKTDAAETDQSWVIGRNVEITANGQAVKRPKVLEA